MQQGCILDDIRVYTVSLDLRNSQARCVPSSALHGGSPIPDGTYVTYARENGGFIRLDGCGVHREVAAGCSLEAAVSWLTENRNAWGIGQPKIHETETETEIRLCAPLPDIKRFCLTNVTRRSVLILRATGEKLPKISSYFCFRLLPLYCFVRGSFRRWKFDRICVIWTCKKYPKYPLRYLSGWNRSL